VWTLVAVVAISVYVPVDPVFRSILKPDSLLEVSVQFKSILLYDDAVALSPVGAAGGATVHADVLNVHDALQDSVPPENPCEAHVWPPRLLPSHCSPASIVPLPQTVEEPQV
jgi:hypothetical protein